MKLIDERSNVIASDYSIKNIISYFIALIIKNFLKITPSLGDPFLS